jgi:hypothetical protein
MTGEVHDREKPPGYAGSMMFFLDYRRRVGGGGTVPGEVGASGSFRSLKQGCAGVLNIGYLEAGPIGGPTAVLMHRWPHVIHSFGKVAHRRDPAAVVLWYSKRSR